jgi:hypothetical protein
MAIQRLTAAYRSRSRPSSTLGAKASTMCPYYLDGDRRIPLEVKYGRRNPGISPRQNADKALRPYPLHWLLCSFQGPRRGETHHTMTRDLVQRAAGGEPVSQNSTARVQSADADSIGRTLLATPRRFHRCEQVSPVSRT